MSIGPAALRTPRGERALRPGALAARFAAFIVDSIGWVLVLVGCAVASMWVPLDSNAAVVVGVGATLTLLVWLVLGWWLGAERGATVGMRLLEIELIDAREGVPVGWGRFLGRALAYAIASATGIGWLVLVISMIRDEHGRGWHDKLTGAIVVERAPTRRPVAPAAPGRTGLPVSPVPAPEPVWNVRLDDGRCVPIDPSVLIGRAPRPGPGEGGVRLVPAGQDSLTVSKTHVLIGVDDQGAYAVDRGSTNGSALALPGNRCAPFPAGRQVRLQPGQVVLFGEHWLQVSCQG